jgi:hypothetical protein
MKATEPAGTTVRPEVREPEAMKTREYTYAQKMDLRDAVPFDAEFSPAGAFPELTRSVSGRQFAVARELLAALPALA